VQRVANDALGLPQAVVLLEDAERKLIGLASFRPGDVFTPIHREPLPGTYIHAIATDYHYHGVRLEDGSSPGDALLVGVLQHIRLGWGGQLPYVWALVSRRNDTSKKMFKRHAFGELAPVGKGDAVWIRAPSPL
jgi:hypothetical protein